MATLHKSYRGKLCNVYKVVWDEMGCYMNAGVPLNIGRYSLSCDNPESANEKNDKLSYDSF